MRPPRRCELEQVFGKYLSEATYTEKAAELSLGFNQWRQLYRKSYTVTGFRKVLRWRRVRLITFVERYPFEPISASIILGGYAMSTRKLSKEDKRKLAEGQWTPQKGTERGRWTPKKGTERGRWSPRKKRGPVSA